MKKIVYLIFMLLLGFQPLAQAQLFSYPKSDNSVKINRPKAIPVENKTLNAQNKKSSIKSDSVANTKSSAKSPKSSSAKDDMIADFIQSDDNRLNVSYEQVQDINQQSYQEMENVLAIVPPEKRSDLVEALAYIERQAKKQDEFIKKYEEELAQENKDTTTENDKENSLSDNDVSTPKSYPTLEAIAKNKIDTKNYYNLKRLLNNNVTAKYQY